MYKPARVLGTTRNLWEISETLWCVQKFYERTFGMQTVRKLRISLFRAARLMGMPEFYAHRHVLDPKTKRILYI
jgi:hypothetical protein